ncbi:MAG: hypothetical protein ACXVDD_22920 [Polyangia bacterium]
MACVASDLAVLANDPRNCGSCGHDCLGGACSGGHCQPMVVASLQDPPYGVAVDANNVYFSRTSGLQRGVTRQPLAGGAPITIYSSNVTSILGLAVAGGTLIVDDSYLHLATLPVPGGAASLTPGYDTSLNLFCADSAHVYYATGADLVLRSIALPLSGSSTPTDVGTLTAQAATALASDGTTLYFATAGTIGGITLPTGTPQLFGNIANINGLAVDGNTLWASTAAGTILTLARSGNVISVVDSISGQATPIAIAVDSSAVYWTNQADATVMRVAR